MSQILIHTHSIRKEKMKDERQPKTKTWHLNRINKMELIS